MHDIEQGGGEEARSDRRTLRGAGARRTFDRGVRATGWLACTLAAAALIGWLLDVPVLRHGSSTFPPMLPNTSVCLMALGGSILLLAGYPTRGATWTARSLAGIAAAVALATMLQDLLPMDVGLDRLLFPDRLANDPTGGRMHPTASAGILMLGTALALYGHSSGAVHRAAEVLVLAVFLLALGTLFRYAFTPASAWLASRDELMPLHLAVALVALASGTALARTDRGRFRILGDPGAAGVALRRLVPVSIMGPFLMGWLTYAVAADGLVSPLVALTGFMSVMCLLLLAAVGWTTRELERIDRERVALLHSEREARAEAEEASVARTRFLGFIGHELRTPLNAVLAYVDLLESGLERNSPEDQRRYLERIRSSGSHLRGMIDEILQFTRSRSTELEVKLREVDAVEVARRAYEAVQHEVDPDVLEVLLQLPPDPVLVRTDSQRVLHVLVNLLGNAIKFTPQGKVGLRLVVSQGRVAWEVWDSGPGISKEDRERIFQEFAQLDGDRGRRAGGVGLGLAICRNYASAVGGHLEVESWPGRGSVFRLVLPLESRRRPAAWRSRPMIRLAR